MHTTQEPSAQLAVVMPVFNEISTLDEIVKKVLDSPWTSELVIIDDGSTDGSRELLLSMGDERIELVLQPHNRGKGAAIRAGFERVTSPYVIIQDADLEYDPDEYGLLLEPVLTGKADVVYGSRFLTDKPHRVLFYWHSVGNRFLTLVSNMSTNLNLTDMETCYKLFRIEVVRALDLKEDRFGIEPEITAKVAAQGWRIWEVGISYAGRTFDEGKKIGWSDGVRAMWVIVSQSYLARHHVRRNGRPA